LCVIFAATFTNSSHKLQVQCAKIVPKEPERWFLQ
jgi:hypothetical protein